MKTISLHIILGATLLPLLSSTAFAQTSTFQFTDVTASAGLAAEPYGGPTRHNLGVVWVDVNNDGHQDIFATNGYDVTESGILRPHLYLNNGDASFTLADNLLPALENLEYVGASAADYDRDGDMDIFVYTANENFDPFSLEGNRYGGPANIMLKNNFVENGNVSGDGQFNDAAIEAGLTGCTPRFAAMVLANDPNAKHTCIQTRSAFFFDYNLDGWLDLYLAQIVVNLASNPDPVLDALGKRANKDVIMRNQGDGTFVPDINALRAGTATQRAALVARGGHLNDDIWPDVYVGNVGGPNLTPAIDLKDAVLINNGAGALTLSQNHIGIDTPAAMGIAMGDVNGDGLFDVYVTDLVEHPANGTDPNRRGNTFYLNHEEGFSQNLAKAMNIDFTTSRNINAIVSWGTNFADFDQDGAPDLFVGAGLNNRDAHIYTDMETLTPKLAAELPAVGVRGSAVADYDQDGDPDLLLINQDGGLQLYRNDTVNPSGSTLIVTPIATLSNPDSIGLRADLYTTSGKRISQQITGGNSSFSQDEGRKLFFGLGGETIDRLEIRWPHPDTPTQIIDSINGSTLTITEPAQ